MNIQFLAQHPEVLGLASLLGCAFAAVFGHRATVRPPNFDRVGEMEAC